MPWPTITRRDRRRQVRDDISAHMQAADANIPNAPLRVMGDAMASLTVDNDKHLDWLARMMMPDTAEDDYAERWANIWLDEGRKPATFAFGTATVTGEAGAAIAAATELTATVVDAATGAQTSILLQVTIGVTLATTTAEIAVECLTPGAAGNLDSGTRLAFLVPPAGIEGQAVVAGDGFSGGADAETDAALIARYIDRIQEPPHGGNAHDYEQWLETIPGIEPGRAWCAPQEMGVGTVTLRFMLDTVRADDGGFPTSGDLAVVQALIDAKRPVTVAQVFVVAPVAQPMNLTITDLVGDTPAVRANIARELAEMLRARGRPGGRIYASWIREAVSAATGEDHHQLTVSDVVPSSSGHLITPGTITYA